MSRVLLYFRKYFDNVNFCFVFYWVDSKRLSFWDKIPKQWPMYRYHTSDIYIMVKIHLFLIIYSNWKDERWLIKRYTILNYENRLYIYNIWATPKALWYNMYICTYHEAISKWFIETVMVWRYPKWQLRKNNLKK